MVSFLVPIAPTILIGSVLKSVNWLEHRFAKALIALCWLALSIKKIGGVSKSMLKKSRLNFDKIEKCK